MIALGCDGAGFALMKEVKEFLVEHGLEYKDFGAYDDGPVDYPVYAKAVAEAVQSGAATKGILICGTGIGISIAANRHNGVRCALVHDVFSAKSTREHNDSNVLAMGGRVIGTGLALEILDTWLTTAFSGVERHQRRVDMIELNLDD